MNVRESMERIQDRVDATTSQELGFNEDTKLMLVGTGITPDEMEALLQAAWGAFVEQIAGDTATIGETFRGFVVQLYLGGHLLGSTPDA